MLKALSLITTTPKCDPQTLSFITAGRIYDSRRRKLIIDLEFCIAYGTVRVPLSG